MKSVFTMDVALDANVELPTSHFELFPNGRWTFDKTENGNTTHDSGTLSRAELAKVLQLRHVSWTTHTQQFHCMAYSANHTEYFVDGKLVYSHRMCDGVSLDKTSQAKLTAVLAIINPLIAP